MANEAKVKLANVNNKKVKKRQQGSIGINLETDEKIKLI